MVALYGNVVYLHELGEVVLFHYFERVHGLHVVEARRSGMHVTVDDAPIHYCTHHPERRAMLRVPSDHTTQTTQPQLSNKKNRESSESGRKLGYGYSFRDALLTRAQTVLRWHCKGSCIMHHVSFIMYHVSVIMYS